MKKYTRNSKWRWVISLTPRPFLLFRIHRVTSKQNWRITVLPPPSQDFHRTIDTVSNATLTLIFACNTCFIAWVYSGGTSLQIHHKDGSDAGRRILFLLMRGQIICWTKKRKEEITETWKTFILHEVLFHKQMWRYKKS
jgi:hypothetical protein